MHIVISPTLLPNAACNRLKENGEEDDEGSSFGQGKSRNETQPNLSVAQIIVTCATPCVEDAEKRFPEMEEPSHSAEVTSSGENDLPEADQKPYQANKKDTNDKEKQVELKEQCEDDDGFGGGNQFEANFEANFEDAFASQTVEQINASAESSTKSDKKDSPSDMPKQVVGGRASIPEELDSQQLARLQNLKESNA